MGTELTLRELHNLRTFPHLVLSEDQWSEHGCFFDPLDGTLTAYRIDRKDQLNEVELRTADRDAFLARYGAEPVRQWLASFRLVPTPSAALVWFPGTQQALRFPWLAPVERLGRDQALEGLDAPLRAWVERQLDR